MNYRTSPRLNATRAAHIAECRARRAVNRSESVSGEYAAETVAEFRARGGVIEVLPRHAVSKVNELKGRYA